MHERHRAERRLTHWSARKGEACSVPKWKAPRCRKLHEQVVRMLMVGDLQTLVCLAHLEDLRVSLAEGSGRFGRDHSSGAERSGSQLMTGGRHQPVLRRERCLAAPTALSIERRKQRAVDGDRPAARLRRRSLGRSGLVTRVIRPGFLLRRHRRRREQDQDEDATSSHVSARRGQRSLSAQ